MNYKPINSVLMARAELFCTGGTQGSPGIQREKTFSLRAIAP
ncbi:hypothetical protein QUB50_18685 [Microcoleus sp. A6-C5]